MKRRWIIRLGLLLLIVVVAALVLRPGARFGVHISGDLADDLGAAMISFSPASQLVPAPEDAALEVIAVTEWAKLTFVPGAVDDCGAGCAPESGLHLVRVIRVGLGGSRKQVFLNLDPVLSQSAGDDGNFALSETGAKCIGAVLAGEAQSLRGGADVVENCDSPFVETTRWAVGGY